MDSSKSHVEIIFYLNLVCRLVLHDPLNTTTSKSLMMDIHTLNVRTHSEGLSFLSKTLPKLGKALDQGLMSSHFSLPREFKSSHSNKCIPAFMQAYFKCVFDETGCLLAEANPEAIKHLRQVLFFAYKLELPYKPSEENGVISAFLKTEEELDVQVISEDDATLAAASYITREVFRDFDPKDILPRHGPGAVATGERLEEKWVFSRLYSSIHQVYPYYDFFVVGGGRELIDRLGWYKSLERLDQGRAKVVLVPKDSRGPRLISCEPLEFQWVQQGLGRKMMSHLESFRMTRGNINFTHQSVNQELALKSSLDDSFATLDLKDASDRVSTALVSAVFRHCPDLLRALLGTRTAATTLPDGRVISLKKFAPMGSALCFPVEAYVFWTLMVAAISREYRLQPSEVGKVVYVYGDDIIVPTEYAQLCVQTLEAFGLRVNRQKCCIQCSFKESCGIDAFKGVVVTPTRLRKRWTGKSSDATAYASYVSLANSLSEKGYVSASDLIWENLSATYGDVPYGTRISAFPCRVIADPSEAERFNSQLFRTRLNRHYQRIEFLVKRVTSLHKKSKLDSWPRLIRDLLAGSGEDPSDVVIPRATKITRGWSAVY